MDDKITNLSILLPDQNEMEILQYLSKSDLNIELAADIYFNQQQRHRVPSDIQNNRDIHTYYRSKFSDNHNYRQLSRKPLCKTLKIPQQSIEEQAVSPMNASVISTSTISSNISPINTPISDIASPKYVDPVLNQPEITLTSNDCIASNNTETTASTPYYLRSTSSKPTPSPQAKLNMFILHRFLSIFHIVI